MWIPYVASLPSSGWDPRTYSIDMMQGVLGNHWELLRPGDTVNVKIIYIPTGTNHLAEGCHCNGKCQLSRQDVRTYRRVKKGRSFNFTPQYFTNFCANSC